MIIFSKEKQEELATLIELDYGFKKDLVEDIRELGIGILQFTVS